MKLIILLVCSLFSSSIFACQCREQSQEQQIKNSDYIYFGKILDSSLISDINVSSQLEVIEHIKGKADRKKLDSLAESHMCSRYAVVGLTYIVFGNYGETPRLNYCSPSKLLMDEIHPDFESILQELRDATNKK
jgi:hypothetical protein